MIANAVLGQYSAKVSAVAPLQDCVHVIQSWINLAGLSRLCSFSPGPNTSIVLRGFVPQDFHQAPFYVTKVGVFEEGSIEMRAEP